MSSRFEKKCTCTISQPGGFTLLRNRVIRTLILQRLQKCPSPDARAFFSVLSADTKAATNKRTSRLCEKWFQRHLAQQFRDSAPPVHLLPPLLLAVVAVVVGHVLATAPALVVSVLQVHASSKYTS